MTFAEQFRIKRETRIAIQGKPLCIAVGQLGIKIWRKGKQDAVLVPYEVIYDVGGKLLAREAGLTIPAARKGTKAIR